MDHTHTRPATRVHLGGDPKGGWIGEIHDGTQNFVHSAGDAPDAASALDQLHQAYTAAGNAAIQGWDDLKAAFMSRWQEIEAERAKGKPQAKPAA
jgi:hypothetical protein